MRVSGKAYIGYTMLFSENTYIGCPSGTYALGGGCSCVGDVVEQSIPVLGLGWGCSCKGGKTPYTWVICARVGN